MITRTLGCLAAVACAPAALADVYYDAVGDIAVGNANLDITQVEMTNDDDNLYMTVSLNGWEDWTKLLVFMDAGAGDTTSGTDNPWGRAISTDWNFGSFYGTYFDSGDVAQNWSWADGSGWDMTAESNPGVDRGAATVSYTWTLSSLGIGAGDTVSFDVATTGGNGGDPGIDLASTSTVQPGWGEGTSQSITPLTYTLPSTPVVPGAGGIAVLAGLGLAGRRRR